MWLFCLLCHLLLQIDATGALVLPDTPDVHIVSIPGQHLNTSLQAGPIPPSYEMITCIDKPKYYPISPQICANVFATMLDDPEATKARWYHEPTTEFGWAPCSILLKKARGPSALELTIREVVNAAFAVVQECDSKQGAGWAQFLQEGHWYLLVHGVQQSGRQLRLPNSTRPVLGLGSV